MRRPRYWGSGARQPGGTGCVAGPMYFPRWLAPGGHARPVRVVHHGRTCTLLRGDEWYGFDRPTGLNSKIRAYYVPPQAPDLERLAFGGFEYSDRGYATVPPFERGSDTLA
jgi:hypothetical protein